MALTPAETQELMQLEAAESGRLSPEETAELAALEQADAVTQQIKAATQAQQRKQATHPMRAPAPELTYDEQLAQMALADMSGPQRFAAGMGQAPVSTFRGVKELLGSMSPEEVAQESVFDKPLLETPGGFTGNIAGHATQMALPAGIAGTPAKIALAEGAYAGLQPGDIKQRSLAAAMGLGGGYMGGTLGQKLAKGTGQASPYEKAINRKALDLGAKMTPGHASKSKVLLRREAAMKNDPSTAGYFDEINDHNQTLLNQYAARAFGEEATEITPDVLGNGATRIGKAIEDSLEGQTVKLDKKFNQAARKAMSKYSKTPTGKGDAKIGKLQEWIADQRGTVKGSNFQDARSLLRKEADSAWRKGEPIGEVFSDLITALDDAAARHVPKANREALTKARRQWKNLIAVEKNMNPDLANVSAAKLTGWLRRNDKGFARGRASPVEEQNLKDMATFASKNREIVGNSGTPARQQSMLSNIASASRMPAAALGAFGLGADYQTAAMVGAATLPLSSMYKGVRNKAYFSDLANKAATLPGIANNSPQLAQRTQQALGLLGGGAAVPASSLLAGGPLANWME